VRGHRIELGEIEQVLLGHPDVKECAAAVKVDGVGDGRLVAYVVPREVVRPEDLRRYLQGRLPGCMVPAFIVSLDRLPVNASGKVDRRALPEPERVRSDSIGEYVSPRTAAEEELAEIWAKVLGVDRVGVHDSFFEIGGHSLLAARLASRVRRSFGLELPLRVLLQSQTISECAKYLAAAEASASGANAPISRVARRGR